MIAPESLSAWAARTSRSRSSSPFAPIAALKHALDVVPTCLHPPEGGSDSILASEHGFLHASPARVGSDTHRLARLRERLLQQLEARPKGRHHRG
jgi:hypothetical protein